MKIKPAFILLALTILSTACSTMKVTSEHDKNFDFSNIKTFQWIAGPADILNEKDTYINEDIQKALIAEFKKLGMQLTPEASKADIQTAYYVKLREELEYTDTAIQDDRDFSGGFVYNRNSKNWSYQEREPDLNVYAVEIGTLTVLAYDEKTGQRIWRGTLQTKIDRSQAEEEQQERIQIAAEKLLSRFPSTSE